MKVTMMAGQYLYFGQHYDRLQRLKAKVDPKDLFHFPTSIEKLVKTHFMLDVNVGQFRIQVIKREGGAW